MTKILLTPVLLLLLSSGLFAGERFPMPDGIYYHRFAASVHGPEAIWINPAGLAHDRMTSVQYMIEYFDGKITEDYGIALSGDKIGIGFRQIDDVMGVRLKEYIFGAGFPVSSMMAVGMSYRYMKSGPEFYNKRHFWNIGLSIIKGSHFHFAMVLSNLNRAVIDGNKTDYEQIYSASYYTNNQKLIFSIETSLSSGQSLSEAVYNYGVEFQATPKLNLYANIASSDRLEFGLKYFLDKYFFGGQTRLDDDHEHLGSTMWGGYRLMPR